MKGSTYGARRATLQDGRVQKLSLLQGEEPMSYASVLRRWQSEGAFRSFFVALLREAPFSAYRWETPPVTASTRGRPFEFVLVDAPALARPPDRRPFAGHFAHDEAEAGVVVFENLGGDATLVVPSPRGPDAAYGHLAAFVRGAPEGQRHALWQAVGAAVEERLSRRPLWLSTAGGGVSWLHVRLDARPKYYVYRPYAEAA